MYMYKLQKHNTPGHVHLLLIDYIIIEHTMTFRL